MSEASDTGVDIQESIQRRLWEMKEEIAADPRLANGGRFLNIIEPDAYGWENIRADAERDRIIVLAAVPRDATLDRIAEVFGAQVDAPCWACFFGTAENISPVCAEIVRSAPLPAGWRSESHLSPPPKTIADVQELNAATGVAPSPEFYMRGEAVPHLTTCIWDRYGGLAACATASYRYHSESRLGDTVFAGSVSVENAYRRHGLGTLVNAELLLASHSAFGWRRALAQAKIDNAASCGMLARCGLQVDADLVTFGINLSGEYVTR